MGRIMLFVFHDPKVARTAHLRNELAGLWQPHIV